MALVVFLRGINVGGHRRFRPSILARALSKYDVVNVGAAGTFVVRKPGSRTRFRAALVKKLPFEAEVALCDGRDLIRLIMENPFGTEPPRPDVVRFVSIPVQGWPGPAHPSNHSPANGEWLVRIIAASDRFVFGSLPPSHEDDHAIWARSTNCLVCRQPLGTGTALPPSCGC